MKEPSEYLNIAKEKVAKKYHYKSWGDLLINDSVDISVRLIEVCDVALQLQQEDAEKERRELTIWYDGLSNKKSIEISRLSTLLESEESINRQLRHYSDQLKAELSQASEEKAKAFDEGVQAMKDKLNDEYLYDEPVNPYKQDTQPKDNEPQ